MYYRKNSRQVFLEKFSVKNECSNGWKGLKRPLAPDFHAIKASTRPNRGGAGPPESKVGKATLLP
jgi:hypothetical protein